MEFLLWDLPAVMLETALCGPWVCWDVASASNVERTLTRTLVVPSAKVVLTVARVTRGKRKRQSDASSAVARGQSHLPSVAVQNLFDDREAETTCANNATLTYHCVIP